MAETSEGAQELLPRDTTESGELRREVGAVLRLPEGNYINPDDIDIERRDDETMIINMGPQHPSTHGVLRLMLELDGETVLRTKPIIGYLHTGMEKTGEELTYVQGATNVTRMDYLSPLTNELVFSMATEALLDVELPPRAVWIRMLMAELQRVSSHLMWMATNGMDLGSTSMMIYGFREREMVLSFFEKTTGLRMNHNYIRPGGVAADLPDGWQDDVAVICDTVMARTFEYDELLTGQPIFRERTEAVGNLSAEEALALSITGPVLRSTGVPWDLRRTMPYLDYDKLDFDVIVGTYGDNFDRYSVRLNEIRESIRMIRQIADRMPAGDYRVQDRKVTPPPRARIDESMEALIHHFKIFTEGFRVPEGEVYVAIESPRGELGCYMVSDGTSKPYRMHIRGTEFRQSPGLAGVAARRHDGGRGRGDLVGGPRHGGGRPVSHLSPDLLAQAKDLVELYPEPRSALIPLCHLAQQQDGWLRPEAMSEIADLVGVTAAEVRGTATFYDMLHTEPVGTYVVSVCTNIACLLGGALELLEHAESALGVRAGGTSPDGVFTLEESECLADCDRTPCVQVNHRYVGGQTAESFDQLVADLRSGSLAETVPPHGTLIRVRRSVGLLADKETIASERAAIDADRVNRAEAVEGATVAGPPPSTSTEAAPTPPSPAPGKAAPRKPAPGKPSGGAA